MPQVYISYLQQTEPNMMFLVRAPVGSGVPIQAVKQAVWSVAPEQPLFDIRPLSVMLRRMTAEPRRSLAVLLGTVGLMAVIVSGAGVFTLVTYVTARRRREIALRRVIGAGLTDVLVMLSAPTLRWTCVGLAGGVAGSMILGDILRSTFAGVAPDSLSLLAGVSALYLAVAAAAMCAPALSALRNDPAVILRSE
jgi:putative ABC transport system permease protein